MVETAFAWVFNLDAEEELRHPGQRARSAAMRGRMTKLTMALRPLLGAADVVVEDNTRRLQGTYIGQAWCPTPTAIDRLREIGATLPPFPSVEILRQVNHRAFNAKLGQTLPHAAFVNSVAELLEVAAAAQGTSWLLKRPFGFSGRHRWRCCLPAADPHEQQWIAASFRHGDGLQMEPWVERVVDCVMHGYIDSDGSIRLGDPAIQECDAHGAWQRTRLATKTELATDDVALLVGAALDSAKALATAGYFGPFGVDSFQWRDAAGQVHWNARGEINARYTMGWHIGMRGWRPQW